MKPVFLFNKKLKITKSKEYQEVFNQSKKQFSRGIIAYYQKQNYLKVGIIVSRKVDKRCVVRNRVKRRLREIFRLNNPDKNGRYILIATKQSANMSFQELLNDYHKILKRLK